jgi:hypothetical protein
MCGQALTRWAGGGVDRMRDRVRSLEKRARQYRSGPSGPAVGGSARRLSCIACECRRQRGGRQGWPRVSGDLRTLRASLRVTTRTSTERRRSLTSLRVRSRLSPAQMSIALRLAHSNRSTARALPVRSRRSRSCRLVELISAKKRSCGRPRERARDTQFRYSLSHAAAARLKPA